eukprot:scaffold923_cov256-Pinguiococcus_pyrenoidosus.AAC.45
MDRTAMPAAEAENSSLTSKASHKAPAAMSSEEPMPMMGLSMKLAVSVDVQLADGVSILELLDLAALGALLGRRGRPRGHPQRCTAGDVASSGRKGGRVLHKQRTDGEKQGGAAVQAHVGAVARDLGLRSFPSPLRNWEDCAEKSSKALDAASGPERTPRESLPLLFQKFSTYAEESQDRSSFAHTT